jgi:hypothetical protein
MWPDQWVPLSVREREKGEYRFGRGLPGPRADSNAGPDGFPGSVS